MDKELPLVSIITPSYNKGRFIEETILSVKSQTYPRVEHIVIDGGSTDGTINILKKYSGNLTWISEPDKGQSDAINKGWKISKGEIIAYLNADDTYMPYAVETAVTFLIDNKDVVLVYGECNIINEHGKVIGKYGATDFKLGDILSGGRCPIPQPSAFYRRSVLNEVGYLDTNLWMAMDLDLWIRISLKFKVQYITQVLANYRAYPETKSLSTCNPFWHDRFLIIEKTFSNPELPSDLRALKDKAYNNWVTQKAFHDGRIALIDRQWSDARGLFLRALKKSEFSVKLRALLGMACAYSKTNLEWLAFVMRKQQFK